MTGSRKSLFLAALPSLIVGCADRTIPVEIAFEARFGERPVACTDVSGAPQLSDLRFFVYDVALIDAQGAGAPLLLMDDGMWQTARLALIDLEDGRGRCENGSAETNNRLSGRVAPGNYTAIEFRIGVPEDLNHADPVIAEPPLNLSTMHWHWRSGYKFMRAGLASDRDHVWLHLGSNRCAGTVGNISGCEGSNRVNVRLPGRDTVTIDMAVLFAGADLEDGVGTDCSSGPAEPDCASLFGALGIDPLTGDARGGNRVFGSRPGR